VRTPATPNHALLRTAPGVTPCAAHHASQPTTDPLTTPSGLRPAPSRLRPRRLRRPPQSLSLGSLGVATRVL
jgi:hypothetical protein